MIFVNIKRDEEKLMRVICAVTEVMLSSGIQLCCLGHSDVFILTGFGHTYIPNESIPLYPIHAPLTTRS